MKTAYVYILTNKHNNVLYVGVTTNLERRMQEHKQKIYKGFTQRYNVDKLVYYETHERITDAIYREKYLKKGTRVKKERHINEMNATWKDLSRPTTKSKLP